MRSGTIHIANHVFETLLAISSDEQEKGLMYIKPPTPIMSFVYDSPKINKFWMKSTPAPLDIVFCHKGKVSQICKGEPYSTSIIGDHKFSDLVVELPYGTVEELNIKIGHDVGFISPDDSELNKIIAETYSNNFKK